MIDQCFDRRLIARYCRTDWLEFSVKRRRGIDLFDSLVVFYEIQIGSLGERLRALILHKVAQQMIGCQVGLAELYFGKEVV